MKLAIATLVVLIVAAVAIACSAQPYAPPYRQPIAYQQPAGVWVSYPRPYAIGNAIWGPFWVFYPIHQCRPQPQQPRPAQPPAQVPTL